MYHHSLARNQRVYYRQCSIARLNAAEGLECLVYMVDTQSLAGTFYFNEVDGHFSTLEEAFDKLFHWSTRNSNLSVFLREWRNLRIEDLKIGSVTWLEALERLYERAVILQDQLDEVHKPQLLLEVVEMAAQDQPFYT